MTAEALKSSAGTAGLTVTPEPDTPAPSLHQDNGMTIADARLEILLAFDLWRERHGLPLMRAAEMFVSRYKHRADEVVSAQARMMVATLSVRNLHRWRSAFRKSGTAALERGAGGRALSLNTDPDMAQIAEGQMWAHWPHISASQIRETLETDLPDRKHPSIRSIQRWMKAWVKENGRDLSAVKNPDRHRSTRKPAFGKADSNITELNQLWELDSTRIDVMCADGRRYALVAAIDVWSRRARCVVAPQSNAVEIAVLVRRCILDWGVPAMVATDEGADYTSRHLRRVFADLEIAHDILPPYSPEKKPFVERFIGTISRDLFSRLPGFVGHDVADREAIRSRQSFASRRGGRPVLFFRCSLTPEQLQERVDAWCENVYERRPHKGIGHETPFARAASWTGVRKTVDPRALDILLAKPARGDGTCTVGKKGIQVDGGQYIAAELGPLVGERVHVRLDPTDFGRLHVFQGGVFICLAEDPLRTGIDRQEVAAQAQALARKVDRQARQRAADIIRDTQALTAIDRVLDKSREDAKRILPFPAVTEEQTGRMIDAAGKAAEQLDKAGPGNRDGDDDPGSRMIDSFINLYLGGNHE